MVRKTTHRNVSASILPVALASTMISHRLAVAFSALKTKPKTGPIYFSLFLVHSLNHTHQLPLQSFADYSKFLYLTSFLTLNPISSHILLWKWPINCIDLTGLLGSLQNSCRGLGALESKRLHLTPGLHSCRVAWGLDELGKLLSLPQYLHLFKGLLRAPVSWVQRLRDQVFVNKVSLPNKYELLLSI